MCQATCVHDYSAHLWELPVSVSQPPCPASGGSSWAGCCSRPCHSPSSHLRVRQPRVESVFTRPASPSSNMHCRMQSRGGSSVANGTLQQCTGARIPVLGEEPRPTTSISMSQSVSAGASACIDAQVCTSSLQSMRSFCTTERPPTPAGLLKMFVILSQLGLCLGVSFTDMLMSTHRQPLEGKGDTST